jgi:hypothetical protein
MLLVVDLCLTLPQFGCKQGINGVFILLYLGVNESEEVVELPFQFLTSSDDGPFTLEDESVLL